MMAPWIVPKNASACAGKTIANTLKTMATNAAGPMTQRLGRLTGPVDREAGSAGGAVSVIPSG